MDRLLYMPLQTGLFTDESALNQYRQDVMKDGRMSIGECKDLFEVQNTHGIEMNSLMELETHIVIYGTEKIT